MASNSIFGWVKKEYFEKFAISVLFCSIIYAIRYSLPKSLGENYFEKIGIITLGFIFFLLLIRFVLFTIRKNTNFLIFVLVIGLILRILWNFFADTQPISDFELMYKTAHELVNGNFDAIHTRYFELWNYNIPFVLYQFVILKVVNSIWALKALNIIFSIISIFLGYRIAKAITNSEMGGRISAFLFATFPPFIIYTSVLTNQTLSIVFILLAYDIYLRKKSRYGTGLFFGLAQTFRPTAVLFLGSFIFHILFMKIPDLSIKAIRIKIFSFLQIIFPYFFVLSFVSIFIITTGLSQNSLFHNSAPNYKILVGLNHETRGQYSYSDGNMVSTMNQEEFSERSQELIRKRLSTFQKVIYLAREKFLIMWSDFDGSTQWAKFSFNDNFIMTYYNILLLTGIFSMILCFKYRPEFLMIFIYTLLSSMLIYLVIEIQVRYRYELYIPIIFISVIGLSKIFEKTSLFRELNCYKINIGRKI